MKLSQIRVYFLYFFQITLTNNIFLLESLYSFIFLYHYNKCYPSQPRVAAKIFVSIISRNFLEIFNCVFCEIFLAFCEISRNMKLKFGRNFCNFAKHEITKLLTSHHMLQKSCICLFCQINVSITAIYYIIFKKCAFLLGFLLFEKIFYSLTKISQN